jgi:hypothetical protein
VIGILANLNFLPNKNDFIRKKNVLLNSKKTIYLQHYIRFSDDSTSNQEKNYQNTKNMFQAVSSEKEPKICVRATRRKLWAESLNLKQLKNDRYTKSTHQNEHLPKKKYA